MPGLAQEPHRPAKELAAGPGELPYVGIDRRDRPGQVLVGQKVVGAAQPVVVDPGDIRPLDVNSRRYPVRLAGHRVSLSPLPDACADRTLPLAVAPGIAAPQFPVPCECKRR